MDVGVYKHYIKYFGIGLAIITLITNFAYQGLAIGSNLWLTEWAADERVLTDTGVRDMYLGVYGAFGFGQGN